jgi:hypothetical protein
MSAKRKWPLGFVVLAVACMVPPLSAVIVEMREYHGKQVSCIHSGLMGVAKACGTERYARVFTGIVRSSVEVGDTDKRLEIVPDEVFVGDSSEATVITNQACLHTDVQAGDKWLFYLYRDPNKDTLVLGYDSPSQPISEAEDGMSLLRDLGRLKNTGILIGTIHHLGSDPEVAHPTPLADHKVVAKNIANGTEYTAYTNEKGHFKFDLPVGKYDVTTAPEYGLREVENFGSMQGSVPVEKGTCWEHNFGVRQAADFKLQTDGTVSGHVGYPDGRTITVHPWAQIVSVDSEFFTSAYVDAKGYFEAKKVKPGRYVVGIGIRPGTGGLEIPIPVYYPGVRAKEQASIIELRPNEKRTDVDFQLPIEDVLKPFRPATSNR